MPLVQIDATPGRNPHPPARFALWNLGFRPFYLLAGIFSALAISIWTANFFGLGRDMSYLRDPLWHAHEMIFGFALAVITGFLFTAVRNWTGLPTPTGKRLAGIAALWLAARALLALSWPLAAAAADTLFVLAVAAGIGVPLYASGNRRNLFLVALLLVIGAVNLAFYLGITGAFDLPLRRGLQLALDLILIIMAVIGGRVIPMFTANAVQANPRRYAWLERTALGSLAALLVATVVDLPTMLIATLAIVAALAHGTRLALWQPWRTLRVPILWIVHASYAWIVVHLALRALAAMELVPHAVATHALTVGAIGGLTLGMMTRTARGHTGRPLQAGAVETACYVLVQLAAVVRVFLPLTAPALFLQAIQLSGALWVAAFALFVLKFAPILSSSRLDGKPG
jgi:uncharacterized protein involved in response to NO